MFADSKANGRLTKKRRETYRTRSTSPWLSMMSRKAIQIRAWSGLSRNLQRTAEALKVHYSLNSLSTIQSHSGWSASKKWYIATTLTTWRTSPWVAAKSTKVNSGGKRFLHFYQKVAESTTTCFVFSKTRMKMTTLCRGSKVLARVRRHSFWWEDSMVECLAPTLTSIGLQMYLHPNLATETHSYLASALIQYLSKPRMLKAISSSLKSKAATKRLSVAISTVQTSTTWNWADLTSSHRLTALETTTTFLRA